jgi:hypothetical protein
VITRIRAALRDRNSAPQWLNRLIDRLADSPMSVPGRVAARRLGMPVRGAVAPVLKFPGTGTRVVIAPVNYSGQGREWARSLETAAPDVVATNYAYDVRGGFEYPADLVVDVPVYHNDPRWQREQFEAVATGATHMLVEAQEPPFGRLLGRSTERQVRALLERGVDVAFLCHGTDIRLPSRNIRRTPWSLYTDPAVYTPRLETLAQRNHDLLVRLGRPVFVSTPDLLADIEGSSWVPVVVETERWSAPRPNPHPGPLRVVHAPSVSALKGTPLITPLLLTLQEEGVIDYRPISGVTAASMPAAFHTADVVLDQFRVGSYGVAACEAMAAGCAVIGHVLPDVRGIVAAATGSTLPIIEATPDTLETALRGLAADRERVVALGSQGSNFVRAVHDGRMSAQVLLDRWLAPRP